MSRIKQRLILLISMMVVRIRKGMRMHNHYPIFNMRMGKAANPTPIADEKKQEKQACKSS